MRKTLRYISLFVFLFFQLASSAQTISTEGTRFWVSFMDEYEDTGEHSLIISAKNACSGIVSNPNTGWSQSFTVGSNGLTQIMIPTAHCYTKLHEVISNTGILVNSTDTISLYASNFQKYTFDVTGVLPEDALGNEYIVQSYAPGAGLGTEFLIVATEDNTVVEITPTVNTEQGKPANTPYTVVLNRGKTYLVYSYDDLSGSIVKTKDCKKIAVFCGNDLAYVPTNYLAADHLYEQSFPLNAWGKQFAITNSYGQTRNRVRVTASEDNTNIYRNSTLLTTINKGGTYEFEITETQTSCFLETSAPCGVYQYIASYKYGGAGDPAMVIVTPIEQKIKQITFGAFNTVVTKDHNVNIVAETTDVSSITLDGVNISSYFKPLTGNPDLSYARIKISQGTHTLSSVNGFIAHAYGYGDYESYAYSVGSSAVNLSSQIIIDDIPSYQHPGEACRNQEIEFKALFNIEPKAVWWEFDDGSMYTGDSITHTFTTNGKHTIDLIVERKQSLCNGSVYDTISTTIDIVYKEKTLNETICGNKFYPFGGQLLNLAGTYRDTVMSTTDCDSIFILNLSVNPVDTTHIPVTICQGENYPFNGQLLNAAGVYYDTIPSVVTGCDSIIALTLTLNPVDSILITDIIYAGQDYNENGFSLPIQPTPGIVKDTLFEKNSLACDSIVMLELTVCDRKDTALYKTICEGSYYNFNGQMLNTGGTYYDTIPMAGAAVCSDSIIALHLSVVPPDSTTITDYIYVGQGYNKNGFSIAVQHTPGITVRDTLFLQNMFTCDSTVMLNLQVLCLKKDTVLYRSVCENSFYNFNGKPLNTAGIYRDTVPMVNYPTCDSVITLHLHVNKIEKPVRNIILCNGDSILFGGMYLKSPGTYTDSLISSVTGCDSIITMNISLSYSETTALHDNICYGEIYDDNGFFLPPQKAIGTTVHQLNLKTKHGCDSTVILHLTVNAIEKTILFDTIAINQLYEKNGFKLGMYYEPGDFRNTLLLNTLYSCDSTVILYLTVEDCPIAIDRFFTPNDDGLNDYWDIENIECSGYDYVDIYDRFGKLLIRYNGDFTPWDGTYLGKPMPSTDYWYLITFRKRDPIIGHFSLIRK